MTASRETQPVTELPAPSYKGTASLEEAIQRRRTVREFARDPLTLAQISQLLWACQGFTGAGQGRAAPSAGATYPLELYLVRAEEVTHYDPRHHQIQRVAAGDVRPALFKAALSQEFLPDAPALFVIAAVFERTAYRYGKERAERYAYMEAGHAAQNLLLQASALGLAAVAVGAFEDQRIQSILSLSPDHRPLYLIAVGRPR